MTTPEDLTIEAWVALVRPTLVRLAKSLLKDEAEAENVVQDTLIAVWENNRQGTVANKNGYARRAVWLNALRRRGRWRAWTELDSAEVAEAEARELAAAVAERDLTAWELEQALAGLPPPQQVVIRLRFYGGKSFAEIGHALSISINTAASRCRYALLALRTGLEKTSKKGEKE